MLLELSITFLETFIVQASLIYDLHIFIVQGTGVEINKPKRNNLSKNLIAIGCHPGTSDLAVLAKIFSYPYTIFVPNT
jgi:hypothetical protein